MQTIIATLANISRNNQRAIDARFLQYSNLFKVLSNLQIIINNRVILGSSNINKFIITGKSRPIDKRPGSIVIARSFNSSSVLLVKLIYLLCKYIVNKIANIVNKAKFSKAKIQKTANCVARYFVLIIVVFTLVVFVI